MKQAISLLKDYLERDEKVVIACSGGPDSMVLLSLLNNLKESLNLTVIVAHVNHKIRKESDEEAEMVKDYALKNNDIFETLEITDYINGSFTEEDARHRRYKFFNEVIKKYRATTLVTAHHGDDLIETILMRLTRGSNLSGYAGIMSVSINKDYKILRPLLSENKEEILKYAKENNIPYAIDKSNESLEYTRNRYRHNVLPFLKKENNRVHEKYFKFSKELEEYDLFVTNYIHDKKYIVDNWIDVNKIKKETEFIKRKTLEIIIKDIQANDYFDISDKQMQELLKLFSLKNASINLNNGYIGVNSYDKVTIMKNNQKELEEVIIDKDIVLDGFSFNYNSCEGDNTNACIYLDSKELSMPLKLRSVNDGDIIQVKNMLGNKKVNDIFIDSKIPRYERSNYPILVDSKNNILWIPFLKKSKFAKDKSEKYDIIIRCKAR